MSEDDFMDIINGAGIEDLQSESELFNMTINDFVRGIRSLSQCQMIIADYIDACFIHEEESDDDEEPQMCIHVINCAKQLFELAEEFIYLIIPEEYDDEEYYDDDDD